MGTPRRLIMALIGVALCAPLASAQLVPDTSTNLTTAVQLPARFDANGNPILSTMMQREIRAQGGTRVPILVPFLWTRDETAAKNSGFKIKISDGNYTAIFRPQGLSEPMDVVIEGTIDAMKVRSRGLRKPDTDLPFSSLGELRGGEITFLRDNAAYLVQFVCRGDVPEDTESCVNETDAQNFVRYHLTGGRQ